MNLSTILKAVDALGPVLNAVPAIIDIVNNAIDGLSEDDQTVAKQHVARLRAQSDALHEDLKEAFRAAR